MQCTALWTPINAVDFYGERFAQEAAPANKKRRSKLKDSADGQAQPPTDAPPALATNHRRAGPIPRPPSSWVRYPGPQTLRLGGFCRGQTFPFCLIQFWESDPPEELLKLRAITARDLEDAGWAYACYDLASARGRIEAALPEFLP